MMINNGYKYISNGQVLTVVEVGKDRKNTLQNYKFRGIEYLYNNLKPIMAKNGVFCVTQVLDSKYDVFEKKTFDSFSKSEKIQINYSKTLNSTIFEKEQKTKEANNENDIGF